MAGLQAKLSHHISPRRAPKLFILAAEHYPSIPLGNWPLLEVPTGWLESIRPQRSVSHRYCNLVARLPMLFGLVTRLWWHHLPGPSRSLRTAVKLPALICMLEKRLPSHCTPLVILLPLSVLTRVMFCTI